MKMPECITCRDGSRDIYQRKEKEKKVRKEKKKRKSNKCQIVFEKVFLFRLIKQFVKVLLSANVQY